MNVLPGSIIGLTSASGRIEFIEDGVEVARDVPEVADEDLPGDVSEVADEELVGYVPEVADEDLAADVPNVVASELDKASERGHVPDDVEESDDVERLKFDDIE